MTIPEVISKSSIVSSETDERGLLFLYSAAMFRIGLALVTFEQDRPFGIMLSDYYFFLSLFLVLPSLKSRLKDLRWPGILLAGAVILCGALLSEARSSFSGDAVAPLLRLFILYGLFAPLALVHSRNLRKNILFLLAGI
jgi:hypothetical protein